MPWFKSLPYKYKISPMKINIHVPIKIMIVQLYFHCWDRFLPSQQLNLKLLWQQLEACFNIISGRLNLIVITSYLFVFISWYLICRIRAIQSECWYLNFFFSVWIFTLKIGGHWKFSHVLHFMKLLIHLIINAYYCKSNMFDFKSGIKTIIITTSR